MIHGYCRTNLDEAKRHKWPTQFSAVPRIGERVKAIDTDVPSSCLKVCGVTHVMIKASRGECGPDYPGIEVELTG